MSAAEQWQLLAELPGRRKAPLEIEQDTEGVCR
jgi:hypothetical protein